MTKVWGQVSLISKLALAGSFLLISSVFHVQPTYAANNAIVKIRNIGPGISKAIKLGLNKAVVIDLPKNAHDILVADPELADAVTRSSRRIYLFGKTVGQTNIFIFGKNGEEIINLNVNIERDVSGLSSHLKRFIPGSEIIVEIISDNIVLTGNVRTPQDAQRAVRLAEIFVKGGEATTRLTTATAEGGDVDISAEARQSSQIVNLLNIDGEDQVTLKVTIAEVSRTVLKQLGVNAVGSVSNSSSAGSFGVTNLANLGKELATGNFVRAGGRVGSGAISGYLSAMEQAGVMRTLAEPSLTAISGEPASFFVGGDFNLVSGYSSGETLIDRNGNAYQQSGTYSSEKVEYGIRLNFTPVVLAPGRISLKVRTEVSEPTFEGSTSLSQGTNGLGPTFLSIRKREAETSVELPSGGSLVIAGLVKDNIRQAMSGFPGVSKIPVLGSLFRSKDFVRNENELVIIATPYLVKPVARQNLARPDDNFNAAGDYASFFLGRVNKIYGKSKSKRPAGQYHGAVGFIYK
jgi:pilus assembly protein CpaC